MKADRRSARCVLLVLVLAALAQGWIALNPGWFSHDELQWGALGAVGIADLPWVGWFDIDQFQFRPLTFNVWLLVSHALFATPLAWHALWVVAGSVIAAAFAALLLRLAVRPPVAVVAALVFALSPYAVYVHGWVATLADLLVVAIGLLLAHALVSEGQPPAGRPAGAGTFLRPAAVAATATLLALLAKESAITFAPLLVLCWALWPRERRLAAAACGASLVVIAYLAVRLPVLLAPGDSAAYALEPAVAPRNWLAYHLYVLRPSTFELPGLWRASSGALALAAGFWLALWALLARANLRLAVAAIVGGTLLLAPVLPIDLTANQYGYAFALWTCACVALAWSRFGRGARLFVVLFAVAVVWHGCNVQRQLRAAGERQAVFQPALVAALAVHNGELRLYVAPDDAWLYHRLTNDVPAWHGAPIGDRVRWVDTRASADFAVAADGRLEPPGG